MEFTRKDRQDYERANELKAEYGELLSRTCDFCKENVWAHNVTPKDDEGLMYLTGFGCPDDFALACEDCLRQFFSGYTCTHENLVD